jgi:uncharacterized cupredoxin-like copper-binding protein
LTFALLAAAAALAGCGGDDETTDTTGASGAPAVSNDVAVSMTEYAMAPSNVLPPDPDGGPPTSKAKAGEVTFTVTNDGSETHSFVFNNAGQEIPIDGDLAPGDSAQLTVDVTSGFYEYYCPIGDHQDLGMQGQLEVD